MVRLPKVIVGLLSRGVMPTAFVETLQGALIGNGELFRAEYAFCNFHIPDDARNTVALTALEQDADFVMFFDTDHVLPKACLAQMIRNTTKIEGDQPFCLGGLYSSRSNDHRLHCYKRRDDLDSWESLRIPLNSGLHRVDAIGTGMLLIDTNVFKVLEWPYFEYEYREYKGKKERLSEDMVFMRRCQLAGIPVYADSSIVAGHISSVSIWPVGEDGGEFEVRSLSGDAY